jgi:EamA domain-containing membrane protein RarD
VKKTFWITAQIVWIAVCLASLIAAYKGYRGTSDWQVEEGLGFEMIVLSFPASLIVLVGFILAGMILGLFGLALPASSKPEMVTTWLFFVAAGYVQWFITLPKLWRWSQNRRNHVT